MPASAFARKDMANPSAPPRPPAYSHELAQLILARGGEPGYAPGGRLPTERGLAGEFGVTRTMVRHALALLEAEGRISREVGRGTFLLPYDGRAGSAGDRDRAGSARWDPPT